MSGRKPVIGAADVIWWPNALQQRGATQTSLLLRSLSSTYFPTTASSWLINGHGGKATVVGRNFLIPSSFTPILNLIINILSFERIFSQPFVISRKRIGGERNGNIKEPIDRQSSNSGTKESAADKGERRWWKEIHLPLQPASQASRSAEHKTRRAFSNPPRINT